MLHRSMQAIWTASRHAGVAPASQYAASSAVWPCTCPSSPCSPDRSKKQVCHRSARTVCSPVSWFTAKRARPRWCSSMPRCATGAMSCSSTRVRRGGDRLNRYFWSANETTNETESTPGRSDTGDSQALCLVRAGGQGQGRTADLSADTKLGALRARVSSRRRFVPSAGGRGGALAGGLGLGLGCQAASAGVTVMTQPGLSFWSWRIR